jgi:hypothetical protein
MTSATLGVVMRSSWVRSWDNVWLRSALLHPTLWVAPWVAVCLALAHRPGSDIGDVSWGFWVIPISAIVSFIGTVVMVADRPLDARTRLLVVLLGLLGSGIAFVLGFVGWLHAANIACHGGYECPF